MKDARTYETVAKAVRFIQSNKKRQPTLQEVANEVHVSKYHFQRLFQEWVGLSPKKFLQALTLEEAKSALLASKSTLEAAYESGLSGNGRLHELFVNLEACTPGEFRQRGSGMRITIHLMDSPFGSALSAETDKGICQVAFLEAGQDAERIIRDRYPEAVLSYGCGPESQKLETFFRCWQLPVTPIGLDLQGTAFQVQVWKALLQIPSGKLCSYNTLAEKLGKPGSSRAVGSAIARNPIAYLIPCHRVIRQDGALSGYRWDPQRKALINAYERGQLNP